MDDSRVFDSLVARFKEEVTDQDYDVLSELPYDKLRDPKYIKLYFEYLLRHGKDPSRQSFDAFKLSLKYKWRVTYV